MHQLGTTGAFVISVFVIAVAEWLLKRFAVRIQNGTGIRTMDDVAEERFQQQCFSLSKS